MLQQKGAYEFRISGWSSGWCSSGLGVRPSRPVMDPSVIGQRLVGLAHRQLQRLIRAVSAGGPQQCMVVRQRFAINEGLGDGAALGEFGFDPFGLDRKSTRLNSSH